MNDRKIERIDGRGFGRQQLLADSIENFVSYEKKKVARKFRFLWKIKWLQATGTGRQGLELGLKLELCRLTNGL